MVTKMPKFESVIKTPIHIHIKGQNTYRTAQTMEEAREIAEDMEVCARKEWEQEHGKDVRIKREKEFILKNVRNYVEYLKKRLWHMARDKIDYPPGVIHTTKEVKRVLSGIIDGTIACQWNQNHLGNTDWYDLADVKDFGRGDE